MTRLRTALGMLAAICLLAGCEFDGQELIAIHDPERDQLDVLIVYRGIYSSGGNIESDMGDLERVRQRGKFAIWDAHPLSVDLTKTSPMLSALVRQIEVENGDFFLDEKGVLCGYQFVRIKKVKRFIRKLNSAIMLSGGIENFKTFTKVFGFEFDDETQELLDAVRKGKHKVISMNWTSVSCAIPLSLEDHRRFKKTFGQQLGHEVGRELRDRHNAFEADKKKAGASSRLPEDKPAVRPGAPSTPTPHPPQPAAGQPKPSPKPGVTAANKLDVLLQQGFDWREQASASSALRFLFENDVELRRDELVTTITIGVPGAGRTHIRKASAGRYQPSLIEPIKQKGWKIESALTLEELERRFDEFRYREARLPPELAERRGK